jgi:AICAR transformylase/IMP cyclohydrolase PurH
VSALIDQKLAENGVSAAQYLKDWGHKCTPDEREYLKKIDASAPATAVAEESEATPVVAPAPSEPVVEAVTETATEAECDEVTDDEIKKFAIKAYKKTANYRKTVDELLDEFAGISPEEARDFTGQALEEVIWDEQQHADQMRDNAAKARDKELAAKAGS